MNSLGKWKLGLYVLAIFLAGGGTGALIAWQVCQRFPAAPLTPEEIGTRLRARFKSRLDLTPDQVRWLCDRHMGVGGNGVLRVVRTEHVPQMAEFAAVAEFFMDYRNADGSLAEMCGKGATG